MQYIELMTGKIYIILSIWKKKVAEDRNIFNKNISVNWYKILSEMKMHRTVFVSPES